MSPHLRVIRAGPALSVQDLGRPGQMTYGLSIGGAADRLALIEGAVLLGQSAGLAALEMPGAGGEFELGQDGRIALTGAPMRATLDGEPLPWNCVQFVKGGQRISIGAPEPGFYGYLHVGGGIETPELLGSRSRHFAAGIGDAIPAGATLGLGHDTDGKSSAVHLPVDDRFTGGTVRVVPSAQTRYFPGAELDRFEATVFTRSLHANRQGVQLEFSGAAFAAKGQLRILSEAMIPGDIQMTGSGNPFVLLPECQTTGGYPRIATVVPRDLPIVAQAAPGTRLNFKFISLTEALATLRTVGQTVAELKPRLQPLIRDPRDIRDLLGYQLISGVTSGAEPLEKETGND